MASKEIRGLFMTTKDEAAFSARLRDAIPDVMFLDDARSGPPHEIESLANASATQAWILRRPDPMPTRWDQLPTLIQFLRSRDLVREGRTQMRVGRMAVVYDDDGSTGRFVDAVWRVFRKALSNRVAVYDPVRDEKKRRVHDVWIGPDAAAWQRGGGLLASNAANLYYAPE
jgi:hypothetical protein